jgi:hypothetical protein
MEADMSARDLARFSDQVAQVIFWFELDSGLVEITAVNVTYISGLNMPVFFPFAEILVQPAPYLMSVTQKINNYSREASPPD